MQDLLLSLGRTVSNSGDLGYSSQTAFKELADPSNYIPSPSYEVQLLNLFTFNNILLQGSNNRMSSSSDSYEYNSNEFHNDHGFCMGMTTSRNELSFNDLFGSIYEGNRRQKDHPSNEDVTKER